MHQVLQVPQLAVPALLLQEIPLEPKYLFSSSTFLEDILTFTNQLFILFFCSTEDCNLQAILIFQSCTATLAMK